MIKAILVCTKNLLYLTVYLTDSSSACFTAQDLSSCPAHSRSPPPIPPSTWEDFHPNSQEFKSDKGCLTQGKLPGTHRQPSPALAASLQCRGNKKTATWTASDVSRSTLRSRQTSCLPAWQTWKKLHGLWGFCSQPNQILMLALLIMLVHFESTFQYYIIIISLPRLPSFREAFWSCVSCKHPYVMLVWLH